VALTSTGACVLGLLQMGPAPGQPGFLEGGAMTGGQVYAAAARSVGRFWNLTRSQVYAELPSLDQAGLIERAGDPGPRGAQPYRPTAAGEAAFREWMDRFVAAGPRDDQLRSPLLLAVFFGHFVDPNRLRPVIQEYRARHERGLAVADEMLLTLGEDRSLPGAALIRRAGYQQLMVDWLAEVLDRIPRDKLPTVQARVIDGIGGIDGVAIGESAFSDGPGVWVGKREIAHFDDDNTLDVRLTKAAIRSRRDALRADERITMRPNASDWLEIRITTDADVEFAVSLVTDAAAANRPTAKPGPPPTGSELERRRRFH